MFFVNIYENYPQSVYSFFRLVAFFLNLAGDGEGGGGLFWDYFGTLLGPLYMIFVFFDKMHKSIKQVSFFDLFYLAAVCFYLAWDGEGGGGPF